MNSVDKFRLLGRGHLFGPWSVSYRVIYHISSWRVLKENGD
jgi:hypothetical protein